MQSKDLFYIQITFAAVSSFGYLPHSTYFTPVHKCITTTSMQFSSQHASTSKKKMKERCDTVALYIIKSHAATENRKDSLDFE